MLPWLFGLLGFGLPLHGGVTVFLPEAARWWKELVLIGLCFCLGLKLWQKRGQILNFKFQNSNWWTCPLVWTALFLAWLSVLVMLAPGELVAKLTAARYLGLPFVVFGIVLLLRGKNAQNLFHKFSTGWLVGSLISVLFGMWAQFMNGYTQLSQWYSQTISSWVPGQTIPLYHQTSEGVVRMQGLSSGPIEFAHLLIVALWISLGQRSLSWRLCSILFLAGIYWSGSRAAMLGAVIIWGYFFVKSLEPLLRSKCKNLKLSIFDPSLAVNLVVLLVLAITALGGLKYTVSQLPETALHSVVRMSDSDHITRPIEAFQMGVERSLTGQLGQLGPAARAYNLRVHNNDQAPIAENVFVDYFAQLGLLGLIFALGFWGSCFWHVRSDWWVLGGVMLLTMQLATILDMTPISIAWFALLAFGVILRKTS